MAANTATILKFELAGRTCIWNPQVAGFDGLNALLETPVTSGEVNSDENPDLFEIVKTAITLGVLRKVEATTTKKSTQKTPQDKIGSKVEMSSLEDVVIQRLLTSDTEALTEYVNKCNDVNELQIMMEKEGVGKNKLGRPREKLRDLIKSRIREIDTPLM